MEIIPHTTRAIGTVLTASIYNADHEVHISNVEGLLEYLQGVTFGINYRETWDAVTTYNAGDMVNRTGLFYVASGTTLNQPPEDGLPWVSVGLDLSGLPSVVATLLGSADLPTLQRNVGGQRKWIDVGAYCDRLNADPTANAAAGIQAALNETAAREFVFTDRGHDYVIDNRDDATLNFPNNARIIGEPGVNLNVSSIGITGVAQSFLNFVGTYGTAKTVGATILFGDESLQLNPGQVSDVAIGDHYLLQGPNSSYTPGSLPIGEHIYIDGIAGDVLTLTKPVENKYLVDGGHAVTIKKVTPFNVDIDWAGKLIGPGRWATDPGDRGLRLVLARGRIRGMQIEYCDYNAFRYEDCFDLLVEGTVSRFNPKGNTNTNVQYNHAPIGACENVRIAFASGFRGKHFVVGVGSTNGGIQRGVQTIHCYAENTWHAAVTTHDEAEGWLSAYNRWNGCANGHDVRTPKFRSIGNRISGLPTAADGHGILMGNNNLGFQSIDDVIEGGLYAVRLPQADIQTGNQDGTLIGPANIQIINLEAVGQQASRSIELYVDEAPPGGGANSNYPGLIVRGLNSREQAGVALYVNGAFDGSKISDIYAMADGHAGLAIQTVGGTNFDVADVRYGGGYNDVALGSTGTRTKNIRQIGLTAPVSKALNAGGQLTAYGDYVLVQSNTGTTDDLDNIQPVGLDNIKYIGAASGHTINVRTVGNIKPRRGATETLTGPNDLMAFICDGVNWNEISMFSADLVQIANLTPGADAFIQRKSGVWAQRSVAQVRDDLGAWKVYAVGTPTAVATGTGVLAQTALATITIALADIGANGVVRVTALWTITGAGAARTLEMYLGGLSGRQLMSISESTAGSLVTERLVWNQHSQTAQVAAALSVENPFTKTGGSIRTGTVDTSAAQDLVLSASVTNVGDSVMLEAYLVEIYHKI
jgi:hypothetical protein